jgi:hypothetical protein
MVIMSDYIYLATFPMAIKNQIRISSSNENFRTLERYCPKQNKDSIGGIIFGKSQEYPTP